MTELKDLNEDPELLDDEEEGVGGDEHYDGLAVETIPYDPALFELENEGFSEVDEDD